MLLSIKELILKAWDLYLDNIKKLWTLVALLFMVNFASSISDLLVIRYTSDWVQIVWRIGTGVVSWSATLLLSVAFLLALASLLDHQPISLKNSLNQAAAKWPIILMVSVASGLIIFGGFILFIVPGIIFAVWYNFAMYEALFQNTDLEQSLRHSHNISRGRFWPVAGRLAIPNIFWSLVLGLLVYSVVQLADQIFAGKLLAANSAFAFSALLSFVTDCITTIATPLFMATGLVLYRNLKEKPLLQ